MRHCYQGTFKDQNGAVVGSSTTSDGNPGTVTVYLAGITTLASVYTAATGGVAVNSVTTDAYGYFYFWVEATDYTYGQLFKIVLTHPDFTTRTYDNIDVILSKYESTDMRYYGTDGIVAALDYTASEGGGRLWVIGDDYAVDDNLTIPSTVELDFSEGATFAIASGKVLTLQGPVNAGRYRIFSGTGTVSFSYVRTVYPEWWGIDGSSDEVEFQAANDSLPAAGGTILFEKSYSFGTSTLILSDHVNLFGTGVGSSKIVSSMDENIIIPGSYSRISEFEIDGNSQSIGTGIFLTSNKTDILVDNLYIHDCGYHGVAARGSKFATLRNLLISTCGHRGINISREDLLNPDVLSHDIVISDCIFRYNTKANIIIGGDSYRILINNCICNGTTEANTGSIWLAGCNKVSMNNVYSLNATAEGLAIMGYAYQLAISNCHFNSNGEAGIGFYPILTTIQENIDNSFIVGDTSNVVISNSMIAANGANGIFFSIDTGAVPTYVSKHVIINGCEIYGNTGYGIQVTDTIASDLRVSSNFISGNTLGGIFEATAGSIVCDRNSGWITEKSSITAAIASGATVAHGLSVTPTSVIVTAAETGPTNIYVTSVGTTTFAVNFGGGGSKTFYWWAKA